MVLPRRVLGGIGGSGGFLFSEAEGVNDINDPEGKVYGNEKKGQERENGDVRRHGEKLLVSDFADAARSGLKNRMCSCVLCIVAAYPELEYVQ